jgi:hypothetical protein
MVVSAAAAHAAGGGIGALGVDQGPQPSSETDVVVPVAGPDAGPDRQTGPPADATVSDSRKGRKLPQQDQVEKFYNSTIIQILVASIIGANFLTNIVEKQIDPSGGEYKAAFKVFELGYNIAFTIELGVNMYAHYWCKFWRSSWNVFDVVVVAIGVVNTLELPLPKAFSLLRMMRAFRVFRLFKRVRSLNKIIVAIVHAIPGVVNAFIILTIVMCIYAILAVEFFKEVGRGCQSPDNVREGFGTKRAYCMGTEYFGTFSKSIYTFFQVLTGESWSENVARPVIWYYEDKVLSLGSALFFVSFVLVTAFVLTNVVVAVLLDKMSANEEEEEAPEEEAAPEEPQPAPTPEIALAPELTQEELKIAKQLGKLKGTLNELGSGSSDFQKEFDRTREDMTEMRETINLIIKAVEKKYRHANL